MTTNVIAPSLVNFACPEIELEPQLHHLTSLSHCSFASCVVAWNFNTEKLKRSVDSTVLANVTIYIGRVHHSFSTGAQSFSYARYGSGALSPFLDWLGCTGSEKALLNCSHTKIGGFTSYYCYNDDVGVRCQGKYSV